jgi:hypothetical protein
MDWIVSSLCLKIFLYDNCKNVRAMIVKVFSYGTRQCDGAVFGDILS